MQAELQFYAVDTITDPLFFKAMDIYDHSFPENEKQTKNE